LYIYAIENTVGFYTLQDKVHLSPKTTIFDAVLIEIHKSETGTQSFCK